MNDIFDTFSMPIEKGAGEWMTFNAVMHDKTPLSLATHYKPQRRVPSAIHFGASRLFVLKRA